MMRVIGELDPGAVPGASTNTQGGEIGSTSVERRILSFGLVPPQRAKL